MKIHFNEKRPPELMSWTQLDVGDIFYHVWVHKIGVKLSKNSFYYFNDKSLHHWAKPSQEGHKKGYKNFIRCNYTLEVDIGG